MSPCFIPSPSRRVGRVLLTAAVVVGGGLSIGAPSGVAAVGTPLTPSFLGEDPNGPGVFRFPQGLAVDSSTGNTFVADQYSGVVQSFNANGVYRFSFGGRAMRRETGRFGVIGGISVDRSGHVFVLDSENNRLQMFAADDGRFLASFGDGGQFKLDSLGQRPDSGIAAGGLVVSQKTPTSTVVVWIADSGNDRVLRYAFSPTTLRPYGPPKATNPASVPLSRPQGVGVNSSGTRVYVPDNRNHRVYVLNARTLAKIDMFGVFGTGPGQFRSPYDVAVDAGNPSQMYVADNLNGRVNVFDPKTLDYVGTFGGNGRRVGQFSIVRALAANATDRAGGVWVADTSNNRIQRVDRMGGIVAAWGIAGRGPGYFTRPRGVAFHPDGRILVADTFDARIAQFSPDGTYVGQLGRISSATGFTAFGSATNEMLLPGAVTVDHAGITWVADSFNSRLVQYSPGGAVLRTTRAAGIRRPSGLATGPDGSVYVANTYGNSIVRFAADGSVATVRAKVSRPTAVAVQANGTVYATTSRTVINAGTGKRVLGPGGATTWDGPQGLAVAADGTLYVAEARPKTPNGARVLRGTPTGTGGFVWETIATEGTGPRQVIDPANLAISPDGQTLLIADAGNNRVIRMDAPGTVAPVTQQLRVDVDGGAIRGTVTSDPPGIDCGTDCIQSYGGGRPVILKAQAAKDSVFAGWGGACAGAGLETSCAVSMAQAQTATATFTPVPPPPVKILGLSLSTTKWHLTRKRSATRRTLKSRQATRARMTVRLSQPGKGRLRVTQARAGMKTGKGKTQSCVKISTGTKVARNKRCTRFAVLPVSRSLRLLEGRTVLEVMPRFGRRTLAPGLYRLQLTVTDEAGNQATKTTRSIRITR